MQYEKKFWSLIEEFIDYQRLSGDKPKSPWHRKTTRGQTAKNQHQVAKRYQGRYTGEGEFEYSGALNSKIESIRNGQETRRMLSDADVKYILNNYSTDSLPKDKPKRIFAGVVVLWSPKQNCYMIQRDE